MTTLYLVSAEKNGVSYWKVGITRHANPLKRDRKHYRETFRAVQLDDAVAKFIELGIAKTFGVANQSKNFDMGQSGRETLSHAFSLDDALTIFDRWVELGTAAGVFAENKNRRLDNYLFFQVDCARRYDPFGCSQSCAIHPEGERFDPEYALASHDWIWRFNLHFAGKIFALYDMAENLTISAALPSDKRLADMWSDEPVAA